MGCFSFICKKSGKPVNSSSFSGDRVHLFLLKKGKVIEYMYGNYNSYGAVFTKELRKDVPHELYDSFEWKTDWGECCDLMFSSDESNGIAAILDKYYDGSIPTTRSERDPDQGWNEEKYSEWVESPIHRIYND